MKIQEIPIELLDSDPNQPRKVIEPEPLANLAGSVSMIGQLQPIIVFESQGRFTIVDGHRRVAALKSLKLKAIDSIVLAQRPTASVLLRTQLAANCLREDLKPLEKAAAYEKLKIENGWSNTELAHAMNVSKATVTQTLAYLKLSDEAKTMLDSGQLVGSTAYSIARAGDEHTQASLLQEAKDGTLTRKDASRRVSRKNGSPTCRSVFRLGEATVTITTGQQPELLDVVDLSKLMIRECRKAAREGLDVSTFERVLADRQRNSSGN